MTYFITFACYGAHLHGEEPGSVDRHHNVPGSRLAEVNPGRVAVKRRQMDQSPYFLDRDRRATVLDACREVCLHHGWSLWAAHVRTNHVHAVVEADVRPEKIMHAFKSYASRNLNRLGIDGPIEGVGRATEARAGCGGIGMCGKRSGMWSRGRAKPWMFTGQSGLDVPLLDSRGSEPELRGMGAEDR